MIRIGMIGTNNTHGHQVAGFINGWREEVPIPTRSVHRGRPLPQFYNWAKTLRKLEATGDVPVQRARVTRLWSESPESEGRLISEACGITDLVETPDEAMEDVDAVLLLTADPESHLVAARNAMSAGLPTFIDKPLAPDMESAREIARTAKQYGTPWFSGSGLRFSRGLMSFRDRAAAEVGPTRSVYVQCSGWIEQYGIHALEILNVLVGHEIGSMHGMTESGRDVVVVRVGDGITAVVDIMNESLDPPSQAIVWGRDGSLHWACSDSPISIYRMVEAFIRMIETGIPPVQPDEVLRIAKHAQQLVDTVRAPSTTR